LKLVSIKYHKSFSEKGLLANIVSRRLARYIFTYEYGRDTIPDSNSDKLPSPQTPNKFFLPDRAIMGLHLDQLCGKLK
jgi:hypothetical protein